MKEYALRDEVGRCNIQFDRIVSSMNSNWTDADREKLKEIDEAAVKIMKRTG